LTLHLLDPPGKDFLMRPRRECVLELTLEWKGR
jgi:hypothetical protein